MTANDEFFQRRKAAAVLKHGVLARYTPVFASMTGSTSRTGRVAYLDGYAGPGRYEPDEDDPAGYPGSPLLAVQNARTVAAWERDLQCIFVERNQNYASNLQRVLADVAPATLRYDVLEGDVEGRLDDALNLVGESPLLAFLDPFGTALPYELMVQRLMLRGRRLKTEVLLNLNLEMVWRIGGLLSGDEIDADQPGVGRSATLERIDGFLGGSWWRGAFLQARISGARGSAAEASQSVIEEFCTRVKTATGYRSFAVPVRRRPHHPPLFLLILFYQHPAARYKFNEAASGANGDWRSHLRKVDLTEELSRHAAQPDLFGSEFVTEISEKEAIEIERQLDQQWSDAIATNIETLVASEPILKVEDRFEEIFGTTMGLAREKHLRRAWDGLTERSIVMPRDKSARDMRKLSISRT